MGSVASRALRPRRTTRRSRLGVILLAVMVCVLIVLLMSTALVRALIVHRRQAGAELRHVQAFWLAESAFQHGLAKLRTDPTYRGGTWTAQPNSAQQESLGTAEIRVIPLADQTKRRLVVTAQWPAGSFTSSRVRKVNEIQLSRDGVPR